MEEQLTIFDMLSGEEAEKFKPIKSTDWKWTFADYPKEKNGLKVFSCFACGGGSTMGYKLAGCDVLGCCEIDPNVNEVYVKNHNPKYNYSMDIRKFNAIPDNELPQELFNLDILDGSPPCTTFSMAGDREDSWGKKKKFREGQAEQTLDDLSFVFIDTGKKLKPKVIIMENVEGLLLGEAWGYVQKIYAQLHEIGYSVKHWLCKGETMGVPQRRHRVFFVAVRKDIGFNLESVDMSFNYEPITYREIKQDVKTMNNHTKVKYCLDRAIRGEKNLGDTTLRLFNKRQYFSCGLIYPDSVVPTILARCEDCNHLLDFEEKQELSTKSIISAQTFPQDFDFISEKAGYICGMSVPPIMIKRIVTRLIDSGVFGYKGINKCTS